MADSKQQLKQAIGMIKAGDRATATRLVTSVLKTDKSNPDAWFVLANALTERDKQIKALENALRLQPGYSRAQAMLDKLRPPAQPAAPPEPSAVFVDEEPEDEFYEDDDAYYEEDYEEDFEEDFEVCGEAESRTAALEDFPAAEADVVLLDVRLPEGSGVTLIPFFREQAGDVPVVVISGHDEATYGRKAREAGANAFLDKKDLAVSLIPTLRQVLQKA